MKDHIFWLKTAATFQLLTAAAHSTSFFAKPVPRNGEETLLRTLIYTYKIDMGTGIFRTYAELVFAMSFCMFLLYLYAGIINWYLVIKNQDIKVMKGIILINILIFSVAAIVVVINTFLPPIILTLLVSICMLLAGVTLWKESRRAGS